MENNVKYALDAMNHAMKSLDMTQQENASILIELSNTKNRLSEALAMIVLLRLDSVRSRQVNDAKRQAFGRWSVGCNSVVQRELMNAIRVERFSHAMTKLTHVFTAIESRQLRAAVELWQEIARVRATQETLQRLSSATALLDERVHSIRRNRGLPTQRSSTERSKRGTGTGAPVERSLFFSPENLAAGMRPKDLAF